MFFTCQNSFWVVTYSCFVNYNYCIHYLHCIKQKWVDQWENNLQSSVYLQQTMVKYLSSTEAYLFNYISNCSLPNTFFTTDILWPLSPILWPLSYLPELVIALMRLTTPPLLEGQPIHPSFFSTYCSNTNKWLWLVFSRGIWRSQHTLNSEATSLWCALDLCQMIVGVLQHPSSPAVTDSGLSSCSHWTTFTLTRMPI